MSKTQKRNQPCSFAGPHCEDTYTNALGETFPMQCVDRKCQIKDPDRKGHNSEFQGGRRRRSRKGRKSRKSRKGRKSRKSKRKTGKVGSKSNPYKNKTACMKGRRSGKVFFKRKGRVVSMKKKK